jgi:flagellar biosynthetic protein FliS
VRGNDIAARCRCANRALAIISELQASLNFCDGGSIAVSLDRLYGYMKQLIFRGNLEHACEPLAEASGLLESLRQAWRATALEGQGMLPHAVPASAASDSEPQLTGINLSV